MSLTLAVGIACSERGFETESKFAVYALIERLKIEFQQLHYAVIGGDDHLVSILDRDIQRSLDALLDAHAATPREFHQQLSCLCDVIRAAAGDAESVRRGTDAMVQLLDRDFRVSDRDLGLSLAPAQYRHQPVCSTDDPHIYQAMLDAMADQVVLVGRDVRVIFANRAFCDAHRVRPLEVIGRHFNELHFGNGTSIDFDKHIIACIAGAENQHIPTRGLMDAVKLQPLNLDGRTTIGALLIFAQPVQLAASLAY